MARTARETARTIVAVSRRRLRLASRTARTRDSREVDRAMGRQRRRRDGRCDWRAGRRGRRRRAPRRNRRARCLRQGQSHRRRVRVRRPYGTDEPGEGMEPVKSAHDLGESLREESRRWMWASSWRRTMRQRAADQAVLPAGTRMVGPKMPKVMGAASAASRRATGRRRPRSWRLSVRMDWPRQ